MVGMAPCPLFSDETLGVFCVSTDVSVINQVKNNFTNVDWEERIQGGRYFLVGPIANADLQPKVLEFLYNLFVRYNFYYYDEKENLRLYNEHLGLRQHPDLRG